MEKLRHPRAGMVLQPAPDLPQTLGLHGKLIGVAGLDDQPASLTLRAGAKHLPPGPPAQKGEPIGDPGAMGGQRLMGKRFGCQRNSTSAPDAQATRVRVPMSSTGRPKTLRIDSRNGSSEPSSLMS